MKSAGKKKRIDATLEIYLQPGAARDRIVGPHGGAIKIAVNAPPEKGKANKALCRLLADELDVPADGVSVIRGVTSRRKQVSVTGADAVLLARLLQDRRKE